MNIKNKCIARLAIGGLSLVLAACGGGSSGGGGGDEIPDVVNQAPSVSLSPISIEEGASATLQASAADADGSIVSYLWEQKSGVTLELSGTDTDTVTIQAPAVVADAEATLAITVTDNDGATASAEVTVTVRAQMASVVIEGVVTDNPVANAQVVIEVAGQSFTTSADANGEYAISVAVDDSFSKEIVRAEATSQDAKLKLVSLMGDVDTLLSAAGEDGVLTRDEHQPVVISNLTTALAAQVEQGEPGSVTTQEQLVARTKMLNGSEVFQLGVLIKLVLDYSDSPGVEMPQNIPDTYALAADLESAAKLAADIELANVSVYQEAAAAIVADQNLVVPVLADVSAIQDTFYFTSPILNAMPFDGQGSAVIGNRLSVASGGAGELSSGFGVSPLTWVATVQGLEISGAEFVARTDVDFDANLGASVEKQLVVQPKRINWLATSAEVDWLLITAETFSRYPNGEYPATAPVSVTDALIAVREAGTADLEQTLQMGVALSIPLPALEGEITDPSPENPDGYLDISSVQLIFAGNVETGGSVTVTRDSVSGTGVAASTQVSSAWTVDAAGHLQIADVLGHSLELVLLEGDNPQSPMVFVEANDGGEKSSTTGDAFLKEAPAWSDASAVGIYKYPLNFFTPSQAFWFEVNADGTALTVSVFDDNGDGEIAQNEAALMPGFWQINAAGNLVIRRYRTSDAGYYCEAATWDPAPGDDCVLYHEREWVVHQDAEGVAVRHYHRFIMDPFLNTSQPTPAEHTFFFGTVSNVYLERVQERPFVIPTM
ncbi:hypothetical protein [Microbulbifer sp. Q7]|uniref:PKD domain-containing protein n=1 Tax=Microbulbifer sp. Q7 TaxID=1785091 RepID=UPI00082DD524|nr:hypothetical protein [Microbulbifer sp. Q7]